MLAGPLTAKGQTPCGVAQCLSFSEDLALYVAAVPFSTASFPQISDPWYSLR